MKTVLALGNPGARYRDTRHNVGWWLADRLCVAWSFPAFHANGIAARAEGAVRSEPVRIVKPLTYVNRSGQVLSALRSESAFDIADLLVVVDDVALPPGGFRLRARGSAGGHNGLASVEDALATSDYGRLRIGVGRSPDSEIDLSTWVLAAMDEASEERVLAAFPSMVSAVECWVGEGIESAMNRFNQTGPEVGLGETIG